MGWLTGALAVACLVVGVLHLVRLMVRRRDLAGELSYAAMGFGMAAMISPLGDPVPAPVWTGVFALCATWFTAAVLWRRRLAGEGLHHVVCSGAMLFMLGAGHAAPSGATAAAGHVAHGSAAGAMRGLVSVAAFALAAYLAWYALQCAERCRRQDVATSDTAVALRTPTWSIDAPQLAASAHVVVAVAMAVLLLGML